MIQYVFQEPVPIYELEAELKLFADIATKEGFDTVTGMVVVLQPTHNGEPFEIRRDGSDTPITRITFEGRLASPRRKTA